MTASRASELLDSAVFGHRDDTKPTLLDRLFARWFRNLVYTQIWEDPVCDLAAMALGPGHRVLTIASGGCNALSYLLADPAEVVAVDLNHAHLALLELKLAAIRGLDSHAAFLRFFGEGRSRENVADYDRALAPLLSAAARDYWEARGGLRVRRVQMFQHAFYHHGLLGNLVGIVHRGAALAGVRLKDWAACTSVEEQQAWFEAKVAPIFRNPIVKRLCASPLVVFNLGIPPAQYEALCDGQPERMAEVLCERARTLATVAPVSENYFAWQAFTRGYKLPDGPLPPYLEAQAFPKLKTRIDRLSFSHENLRQRLEREPAESFDRYVLLDAQDWMTPAEIARLWEEITRTARPGARVIFRAAGRQSPVDAALPETLRARWVRDDETAAPLHERDRSGIYGAFFLYRLA